ncbi:MAG TPA: hypothetical protein PJ988_06450, partial [Anaerolinea sp.]|nr:hypothetical protein [Anaerolinea sp.]
GGKGGVNMGCISVNRIPEKPGAGQRIGQRIFNTDFPDKAQEPIAFLVNTLRVFYLNPCSSV